jgi:hypothetical protein
MRKGWAMGPSHQSFPAMPEMAVADPVFGQIDVPEWHIGPE